MDELYQRNIGQRFGLSFLDAMLINKVYCKDACSQYPPLQCQNGGYPDPNNCYQCQCPEGLAGGVCDEVAPSTVSGKCNVFV